VASVTSRHINPIIIDLEASGFGVFSYPIEVGVAMDDGDAFGSLIEPASDWTHWDNEAECVHRLSRQTLHSFGQPLKTVAQTLNALLDGRTVYSDCWVVDRPWLTKLYAQAGLSMTFRVSPIELIMTEVELGLWDSAKRDVTKELGLQCHRASFDAAVIQETYRRVVRQESPL
jgi:hypothetical protein